jgi:hypothetical protein
MDEKSVFRTDGFQLRTSCFITKTLVSGFVATRCCNWSADGSTDKLDFGQDHVPRAKFIALKGLADRCGGTHANEERPIRVGMRRVVALLMLNATMKKRSARGLRCISRSRLRNGPG